MTMTTTMKKKYLLLPVIAVAVAICGLAFTSGLTSAFFIDRDMDDSARTAAGYLEVSVDAELSGYGVPGSTLKLGAVELANMGSTDMTYELRLIADADTAKLLDFENGAIMLLLTDGGSLPDATLLLDPKDGSITLLYYGELKLGDPKQSFDIELTFKGAALVDGNDYQNKMFYIAHEVTAYQTGVDAFDKVNTYAGGGE